VHRVFHDQSRAGTRPGVLRSVAAFIALATIACSDSAIEPPASTSSPAETDSPSITPMTLATSSVTPWRNEDFTTYGGSTSNWKSDPHAWRVGEGDGKWTHQQNIFIDTQVLYNGHPTLRYDWPGPPAGKPWGGCSTDPAIVSSYTAPSAREVWIEAVHKFRGDFNTKGPGCGPTAYKFLLMWRPIGDRYDIRNGVTGKWWSAAPQKPAYAKVCDNSGCYCTGYDSNCRWGFGLNQSKYTANVPGTWWDGQWHVYRVHIKISSSATTADGVYEVWLDGRQVVGRYGMKNAKADGSWSGRLSEIYLGSNSNSGTYVPTKNWWGHLKIYTSNPGW
jgi:hypothetical protein